MTEAEKRVKAISLYDNWCETDTEDTLEIYCYEKGRENAIDEVVNLYEKWTKLEKPQQAYYWTVVLCKLKEIAEQLKEKKN